MPEGSSLESGTKRVGSLDQRFGPLTHSGRDPLGGILNFPKKAHRLVSRDDLEDRLGHRPNHAASEPSLNDDKSYRVHLSIPTSSALIGGASLGARRTFRALDDDKQRGAAFFFRDPSHGSDLFSRLVRARAA